MLSSLASGHMVTTPEERQHGVLAIDIGGGHHGLCALPRRRAPHDRRRAGRRAHLTNDLSIGLRLTEPQAEKLKLRFGRALVQTRDKADKVWLDGNFAIGDRQFPRHGDRADHAGPRLGAPRGGARRSSAAPSRPETCAGRRRPDRRHGQACRPSPNAPPRSSACRPHLGEAPHWVAENLRDPGYHTAPRASSTTAFSAQAERGVLPAPPRGLPAQRHPPVSPHRPDPIPWTSTNFRSSTLCSPTATSPSSSSAWAAPAPTPSTG